MQRNLSAALSAATADADDAFDTAYIAEKACKHHRIRR